MNITELANLRGQIVHMIAHGDYLYVGVMHLGNTVIYEISLKESTE